MHACFISALTHLLTHEKRQIPTSSTFFQTRPAFGLSASPHTLISTTAPWDPIRQTTRPSEIAPIIFILPVLTQAHGDRLRPQADVIA
jgi:hypothetical protein